MPIFPKVNAKKVCIRVTLSSCHWHFLRALFYTSRVPVLTVRSEFVISSHPVCVGFTLEKKCTGEHRVRESNVVYAWSGPSAFLSCFGCIVVSGPHALRRCTAAVPGTKTPCRTITLNKSLHPMAIRRGVLRWLFIPVLLSKQDQNDRAATIRPSGIHRSRRCSPRLLKISKALQLSRSVK